MFPSGHNEKWTRGYQRENSLLHHDDEFRSFQRRTDCPQHFYQQTNGYEHSLFGEKAGFHEASAQNLLMHLASQISPMEFAKLQLELLASQNKQRPHRGAGFGSYLMSPPATVSSSRSTVLCCNPAPPYASHCQSPAASDDFGHHFGSFDSMSAYNFHNNNQQQRREAHVSRDGKSFDQGNIYTAEDVHTVVKNHRNENNQRVVSNKVFVGGISHMMNRKIINKFFGQFGTVFVDWPVKQKPNSRGKSIAIGSYSYLFLVYSDEQSVIKLMSACHRNSQNDFFVSVPGFRDMIQIRPWFIYNGFYILEKARHNRIIDIHRTVFLGGLPRIVTAEEIAQMFSEFGVVLLVTIDIDQDYGYPKGAARVTFERDSAFNRALEKKFLKFDNIDSSKTMIEIKPYVMEDVGCDECGGLWFNPFLSIYDHLKCAKDDHQKEQKMAEIKNFNMWSSRSPFSLNSGDGHDDLITKMDAGFKKNCNLACTYSNRENEKNETEMGARKFLEMVKSFGLEKEKTVTVNGNEYPIGPDLWDKFLPAPKYDVGTEPVRMNPEAKLQQFLRMKRTNVYSNKSAYCKEAPCRQYYCPSCSNKLHSGPNQHTLLPAGKPERRPRKDKNMYLVNMGK